MNRYPHITRQTGAVLVVSLMLLVIMTLIGVTAMRSTILEEKMAGNSRNSMLALQTAETALLDGEDYLANEINSLAVAFDGTQLGLYELDADPSILADATWVNSITYRGTFGTYPGVNSQPRFIIEFAGPFADESSDDLNISSYDALDSLGTPYVFRITARGTGGSDNAVVFLQSNYVRTF